MSPLKRTLKRLKLLFRRHQFNTPSPLEECYKRLGYTFTSSNLIECALTHRSYISQKGNDNLISNERLEFLGDAVINFLVTEHLYLLYPGESEGTLSKIKSLIVSRKVLGEVAFSMDLGKYIFFGSSEKNAGGRKRKSILSNTFEAVAGAIYLDGGIVETRNFLRRELFNRIDKFSNDENLKNYKSKILEYCQHDGFGSPVYGVVNTEGPDHARNFTVNIKISGIQMGTGKGKSKKVAEQKAAYEAVKKYDVDYIKSRIKGV